MKKIINKLPILNDFYAVFSSPVDADDSFVFDENNYYQPTKVNNYQKIYLLIIKSKLYNVYSDIKQKEKEINLIFNNISKASN